MFPKPKRIVDKSLLAFLRTQPCICCHRFPPNEVHHIKTRGSGGDDTKDNCIAVCRHCHMLAHSLGIRRLAARYRSLYYWLKDHPGHVDVIEDIERAEKLN